MHINPGLIVTTQSPEVHPGDLSCKPIFKCTFCQKIWFSLSKMSSLIRCVYVTVDFEIHIFPKYLIFTTQNLTFDSVLFVINRFSIHMLLDRLILIFQSHEIEFHVFNFEIVVKFIFLKTDSHYAKSREGFGFLLRVNRFLNAHFVKKIDFYFLKYRV